MDFLQIVLDGWFNSINRENLENYFLRSFKKAERDEFLDLKTFYDGCYNASQFLINEVETKNINKRINELYFMLSAAKSKTMNFDKEDETKTYEERCAEIIEYCEHELNFLNNEGGKFGFSYPLFYKGINYQCKYGEMLYLQESIIKFFMSEVEIEFLTNQKAESIPAPQQEQPIKFTAKEYALAYIFDLYANGRQIPINRIEGSLSKKEIEQYGKDNIQFIKPDTFYNAVKDLNKNYNVSIIKDLQNISQDWLNAVKSLAKDWKKTKAYLTEKELYRE